MSINNLGNQSKVLNFVGRFIERRASMMPTLVSLPSLGFFVTTATVLVTLSIISFLNKKNQII